MRDAMESKSSRAGLMHAPFARPGAPREVSAATAEGEMPSIQDFLDDLPSIDDYIWAGKHELDDIRSIDEYLEDVAPPSDYDDAGWAIADWQSFDWSGAAMLGSRGHVEGTPDGRARAEAKSTDRSPSREITPSADEVARALDGIAQRIRSGELLIDQLTGAPPEAAMAAALAALLRMRS